MRCRIFHINLLTVCCLLLMFSGTSIASAEVLHQPGFYVEGGARMVMLNKANLQFTPAEMNNPSGGMGWMGGAGFEYRLQANHFLMGMGVGFTTGSAAFHLPDSEAALPNSVDQDGDAFTFVYQFSNHSFKYSTLSPQVSLAFGGTFNNVYFLLGGAFHIIPLSWGESAVDIATYGDYPQFLDPFTGMPEHEYFNTRRRTEAHPSLSDGTLSATVSATAEIGYTIAIPASQQREHLLRIAFFADYAFLNLLGKGSGGENATSGNRLISIPSSFDYRDMFTPVQLNPLVTSSLTSGIGLGQASFGLKFSYAISIPSHKRSPKYPCVCLEGVD